MSSSSGGKNVIFYSFSLKQRVLASKSATFDIHTDHELLFDHFNIRLKAYVAAKDYVSYST